MQGEERGAVTVAQVRAAAESPLEDGNQAGLVCCWTGLDMLATTALPDQRPLKL